MNKTIKFLWISLGIISFILGSIGIVLPVMPTVPFYLFTLFCFSKGSKRLHNYFKSTKLYNKYLKNIAEKNGMTLATKLYLSWIVFSCLLVSFYFSKDILIAKIAIISVWLFQLYYFIFKIKTIKE